MFTSTLTDPTFFSLLPPFVAVTLAIFTKRSGASLLTAAAIGALVSHSWAIGLSLNALVDYSLLAIGLTTDANSVWHLDTDHLKIMAFSVLIAGIVGILDESGGTRALVSKVERLAKGPRGAMVASWLAGWIVFFDDYANCLVVGSSMRPLTDRFGVSRAKLAYIVDSTAAPVASLALVSTWVGYEIGLIDDGLGILAATTTGLEVYISSIPYRFYALFTLAFVGIIAMTGRDFGPMLTCERAARANPIIAPIPRGTGADWRTAALPIIALLVVTMGDLYRQGLLNLDPNIKDPQIFEILGAASAFDAMLLGAVVGYGLAILMTIRALGMREIIIASWGSVRVILSALGVLLLAWVLGSAITDTGAALYLQTLLSGSMNPALLPAATFVLAAIVAFSTGTSWGTMSMLFPIALPLAISMTGAVGHVTLATTSAILAGACFGDHSSPISDTTILSAVGANVDLSIHIRTQLPYALTSGMIALVFGYIPAGYGVSPWILIPVGLAVSFAVVRLVGKHSSSAQMRKSVNDGVG